MDENVKKVLGFDETKEILDLWYEVSFLRFMISHILSENPQMNQLKIDHFNTSKGQAQQCVKNRFPAMNLTFSEPKVEES